MRSAPPRTGQVFNPGRFADSGIARDKVTKALLGKNDFRRLGQLGDGQFGRVSYGAHDSLTAEADQQVTAVMCKFNSAVYAMKSVKKHTAQRAGVVCLCPQPFQSRLLLRAAR